MNRNPFLPHDREPHSGPGLPPLLSTDIPAAGGFSAAPAAPGALDVPQKPLADPGLVGHSSLIAGVSEAICRFAPLPECVFIRGETGTGKSLVANLIHLSSPRRAQPFIWLNCGALPEPLLECELFGHERGAFTGAHQQRLGRFEQAGRGTLFLDEIGEMTAGAQVKLLRAIEEHQIERVGGNRTIRIEARVLAATNCDLAAAIGAGRFRRDLFYRLNRLTIELPPLRCRPEDVPHLVQRFLAAATPPGAPPPSIAVQAVDFLVHQDWPGNVRQLQNVIHRAAAFADGGVISLDQIRAAHLSSTPGLEAQHPWHPAPPALLPGTGAPANPLAAYLATFLPAMKRGDLPHAHKTIIEQVERHMLAMAMAAADGNQSKAAAWLGISRDTLRERLHRFALHTDCPEPDSP